MSPGTRSPSRDLLAYVVSVGGAFALAWSRLPVDDPPGYFRFVDGRSLGGVPNAWNVLTNLPFLAVAGAFLKTYGRDPDPAYRRAGLWLVAGTVLTGFGSAWFHWAPTPASLFWDRLPMALAFSGVTLLLVSDRFSTELGAKLAWPLPIAAVGTVLAWRFGGNLRPYVALQFGLMAFTLLVALLRPSRRIPNRALAWLLGWYGVAKAFEAGDAMVFGATAGFVSGHALKHLAAAVALGLFAKGLATGAPAADGAREA